MAGSVREPAVAGQFYAEDAQELAHQLEGCFTDARGPGHLPSHRRNPDRRIRAAIVPHAGYPYSGPIAAHVYRAIASERSPETVLILGVDHRGLGIEAALSDRPWKTPLGPVEVDHDLVKALAVEPLAVDEPTHAAEHSIEVQLPFLQYVIPRPRIVALMVRFGPFSFLEKVAAVVREAIVDRDLLLLASTDFSHYIPAKEAQRLDRMAIDRILAEDARGLYDTVVRNDISMCGIAPTTVLLSVLASEPLSARLLRWGHSGESEEMRQVVGYAGILLESQADDWTSPQTAEASEPTPFL